MADTEATASGKGFYRKHSNIKTVQHNERLLFFRFLSNSTVSGAVCLFCRHFSLAARLLAVDLA